MIVTGAIDAKQNRDIMTLDIPNTFVQTGDPHQNGVERIMINIRGVLSRHVTWNSSRGIYRLRGLWKRSTSFVRADAKGIVCNTIIPILLW